MNRQAEIDADVIGRIVVEDELLSNPYRELDTLVAKLTSLKSYLTAVASQNDKAHYDQVTAACGIFPTRHGPLLGILGIHEAALGNPLLPAIVVRKTNPVPQTAIL